MLFYIALGLLFYAEGLKQISKCQNCKFMVLDNRQDVIFSKCSIFLTKESKYNLPKNIELTPADFPGCIIVGENKEKEKYLEYCFISRNNENLCGKEAKYFIPQPFPESPYQGTPV